MDPKGHSLRADYANALSLSLQADFTEDFGKGGYSGIGVFLSWNHENRNVSGFPDAGIDFGEWLRLRTSQDHRFPVAGNDNTTTLKLGTPSRKVPAIGNIELVVVNEDGG